MNNFDTKVYLPRVLKQPNGCTTVASGSDIYVVDRYKCSAKFPVDTYSYSTNSWKSLCPSLEVPRNSCVCSYMQNLFLIGGANLNDKCCVFYNKQNDKWTYTAAMMETRRDAACTVFQGKIVFSGGFTEVSDENIYGDLMAIFDTLRSVEEYDYHENK